MHTPDDPTSIAKRRPTCTHPKTINIRPRLAMHGPWTRLMTASQIQRASLKKIKVLRPAKTEETVSHGQSNSVEPVLNWANVCSPNILRTLRRTVIRFSIELLVRRIWFGQSKLYFILNWLVMRCKLRPELAADAQQTA